MKCFVLGLGHLHDKDAKKNDEYHSQNDDALHLSVLFLVPLGLLELLKTLFHLDIGVLDVVIDAINNNTLKQSATSISASFLT